MNVRSIILVLALGLPALGLLAFGPRGQYGVPPARTVVRYWEKWTGVEGQAMQRIVERFNSTIGAAQHIWVEYSAVSSIEQRTLIATAGGDPPDIAGLYDFIVPQYADQGALRPLDDLLAEFGIDPGEFQPIWLDICRYKGQLFALPSTPYTIALYYNRELFRRAGLDPDRPPQTLAEFSAYAQRLTTRDAEGRIVQAGFTPSMAMLGWWPWIWPCLCDGRLWDGQHCTLDTPAGRAAVNWLADLRDAQGALAMIAFEGTAGAIESAQNPFLSGRIAMVYQGPWMSNWIAKYAPTLDYDVALFPSVTRERRNVFASSDVFVIPTGARHPREAMTFLAYVLRQDVMEELCRNHNKISPFLKPGADFFAGHPNPHIRVFAELAASPDAFSYPQMPMWLQVLDELKPMLNTVLKEPQRANVAIETTQRKVNQIVQDYQDMAVRRGGRGGGDR
jgi:ABC-type glycerol-3-phosphate transport system substrate-binding protein